MKYKPLGRTGLFVSELCLGTMTFGGSDDGSIQSKIGQLQQEEAERIVGSSLGATKVALGADELKRLDAVSRLPSEYPGWMFARQGEVRRKQLAEAGCAPAALLS